MHSWEKWNVITGNKNIADVFSIFHDGTISTHRINGGTLELEIEIKYLAERVNPAFTKFFLRLFNIKDVALETWPQKPGATPEVITDLPRMFSHDPWILSGSAKNGKIEIALNIRDGDIDYSGGTVSFLAESAVVLDEGNKECSVEELGRICEGYWTEWEAKWKRQPFGTIAWMAGKIVGFVKWFKNGHEK